MYRIGLSTILALVRTIMRLGLSGAARPHPHLDTNDWNPQPHALMINMYCQRIRTLRAIAPFGGAEEPQTQSGSDDGDTLVHLQLRLQHQLPSLQL